MTETVGERVLRIAKAKKGWGPTELASQLGVSYETVRKWERGQTAPNRSRQAQLAKLLGTRVDVIMFTSHDEDHPSGAMTLLEVKGPEGSMVREQAAAYGPASRLAACVVAIGKAMAEASPTKRRLVGVLLQDLVEAPDKALEVGNELAAMLGQPQLNGPWAAFPPESWSDEVLEVAVGIQRLPPHDRRRASIDCLDVIQHPLPQLGEKNTELDEEAEPMTSAPAAPKPKRHPARAK
jgi:transcriptional regulator with XRE-family HTH domain